MLPINLIPDDLYEQIFKSTQDVCPNILERPILQRLHSNGLGDVVDGSEFIDIGFPQIDKPLPEWVEHNAWNVYGNYHITNDKFQKLLTKQINPFGESDREREKYLPVSPPTVTPTNKGWSKFVGDGWVSVDNLPENLLLDFESYKCQTPYSPRKVYLPFIAVGISDDGDWFCWIADDFANLPQVVNFPGLRYGIGHNVVGYDRRYIKEAYDFGSDLRFFDTFSMYHMLMGMASSSQRALYLKAGKGEIPTLPWMRETCSGSLASLYSYFTRETICKDTRDDMQNFTPTELEENINSIFEYCAQDVAANLLVFANLWGKWKNACSSIVTLGGQIERSTFRLGVVEDYHQRLAKIDSQILAIKENRNLQIVEWLEKSKNNSYLQQFANDWLDKEWEVRLKKAKNKDKIKRKTYDQWIKSLWKKAKFDKLDINPASYISITSKAVVYALQIKWNGFPLEHDGIEWGIWSVDQSTNSKVWQKLPHPKGSGNVGTPLSKDFKNKAVVREFTSTVADLVEIYDTIDMISTWVSFRDRMYEAYIINGIWLTDNIPCGTVSERIAGTGVLLPNTKPKKAGTEVKHFFRVVDWENNVKIDGDYASQENLIFAAIADSKLGYVGSTPSSVLTLSGTDAHDRTGGIVLGMLTDEQKTELEQIYGTPLLKKLRVLWKNINYANQFLCGKNRQASQIYLAVQGKLSYNTCYKIAEDFITESRGVNNCGTYENGFASEAYNGCKENMVQKIQKSFIYKRHIATSLQERYCGRDFVTTRFNFNIQQTGQELVNTCLVTVRILQKMLENQGIAVRYHTMNVIHDQLLFETSESNTKYMQWMFQIGHSFSKMMLYQAIGINQVPVTGLLLDTVEIDKIWRKSPDDSGITPSNSIDSNSVYRGEVVPAKDCRCPDDIDIFKFESLPATIGVNNSDTDELDEIASILFLAT